MLVFTKVKTDKLKAITHVDQSTRVQTVSRKQNKLIYDLLISFEKLTNYAVLCNTSLNFNGHGFMSRSSELYKFSCDNNLDGFSLNGHLFLKN